ncbi:MAG: hypothetical protein IJ193_04350, partial [Bacilli bacterium]|nr:hypothetical protein [Bacilli bacterium]
MPRPNQKIEKVNDFKGSTLRLFQNLDKWRVLLVISIILALLAAALSTVAPNKLADVTDVISEGIKPRVENVEKITKEIYAHLNIPKEIESVPTADNPMEMYQTLSKEQKLSFVNEFELEGVTISKEDQVEFLDTLTKMQQEKD